MVASTTAPRVIFCSSFHIRHSRHSTINLQQPEFVNSLPGPYLSIEVCKLSNCKSQHRDMYFACENRSWPLNSSHSFPELYVEKWENQGCSPFPQQSCWTQGRCWANCRSPWDRRFCSSYLRVSASEQTDFNFDFASAVKGFYCGWFACGSLPACKWDFGKRRPDFYFSLILLVGGFVSSGVFLCACLVFSFFFFSKMKFLSGLIYLDVYQQAFPLVSLFHLQTQSVKGNPE